MSNGKNKELLRANYKAQSKKEALTKAGNLTADYQNYLTEECTPHWASVLSKFSKKVADVEEGKIKAEELLAESRKATILEEKCAVGIGGKLSSLKAQYEKTYNIEF